MSIHQEFADAILSGEKTVEFRKRPVAPDVTHVVIYVTQPVSAIVGIFEVRRQVTESPARLWRRFGKVAGISRQRFFQYYHGRTCGTGIEVARVQPLETPLTLSGLGLTRPPQSYQYLDARQSSVAMSGTSPQQAVAS
ncbi:ASCH domain-containing protein [Kribbella sp. NPDC051952]|uniref:ASCH domain-containing protein n=1 Tax=Kribbella sp. NPDC051952 TaxID=3154851 RepID=UPI0034487E26